MPGTKQNQSQDSLHDDDDESDKSDQSSNDSPWSEFSDDDQQSKDKNALANTADNESSVPRFYIETNLKLLAKVSIAIRRSGSKLRSLNADADLKNHLEDDEYIQLRNHLLFLILVGTYEQQLFSELRRRVIRHQIPKAVEIVIGSWIVDPARATTSQHRLIETNITRRNRIAYARRSIDRKMQINKVTHKASTTAKPLPVPDVALQPAKEPNIFDMNAQKASNAAIPSQEKPDVIDLASSLTEKTLTASELGSQFAMPVMPLKPDKGPVSIATKMTQTGVKQHYPPCPAKKGSFECPYCIQVLPEEYIARSRWR